MKVKCENARIRYTNGLNKCQDPSTSIVMTVLITRVGYIYIKGVVTGETNINFYYLH